MNRTWHSSLVPSAKLQRLQRHPATLQKKEESLAFCECPLMRCGQQTELLDPSSFYIMNYSASYMLTLWIIFHVSPVHKTTLPPTSTAIWIFYCRAVGVTHLAIRAIEKKPFKQNHNKQKCRMACNLEQNAALSLQNYSKNRPRIPR